MELSSSPDLFTYIDAMNAERPAQSQDRRLNADEVRKCLNEELQAELDRWVRRHPSHSLR